MDINQRHKMIIDAIVQMYIDNGEPIASQALQDALDIQVSSATLRNEMARLTKLGYLNQPHVSAGRIPTNKAYRYYVDNLDRKREISPAVKEKIKEAFDSLDADSARFLPEVTKVLSDFLGYPAVVVPPKDDELQFAHFQLLKTGRYTVVLVGTTTRGEVQTRVIRLKGDIENTELLQLNQILNMRLCFTCIDDLNLRYFTRLEKQLAAENPAYSQVLKGCINMIKSANHKPVYVSGEEKLFRTDHFKNNISDVLSLLRDTEMLKKVVEPKYDGVSVVFGDELPVKNLENTCFISTKYYRGSAVSGAISVICPQTVQYDDLFLKVAYFAQLLTQTITGTERK